MSATTPPLRALVDLRMLAPRSSCRARRAQASPRSNHPTANGQRRSEWVRASEGCTHYHAPRRRGGHDPRQHPRHHRQHAGRPRQPPRPGRTSTIYVKCEAFNPMSSVKDRLAIAMIEDAERRGHPEARADRDRADLRQHRHRAGHGLRGQGLPVRGDHVGQLQRRAAQADEGPGRQGGAHAGRRARVRAW